MLEDNAELAAKLREKWLPVPNFFEFEPEPGVSKFYKSHMYCFQ